MAAAPQGGRATGWPRHAATLDQSPHPAESPATMILLIDNYDSFTFNLYHFLGDLGAVVEVRRNDALSVEEALALQPEAVVLSPGPCTPNEAGISLPLIAAAAERRLPLLGVCLGHQAIGQAFGGKVVRAPTPVHGKVWDVIHDGTDIFAGLPSPFRATRYHSLVVEDLPETLVATARTADGLVMGLAHRDLPIWGVQFHPESIASEHGHDMLRNFLSLAGVRTGRNAPVAA
jgi:anthranilate synthase/aminodeoxychorismate synthase-like glutamine amidotransferase